MMLGSTQRASLGHNRMGQPCGPHKMLGTTYRINTASTAGLSSVPVRARSVVPSAAPPGFGGATAATVETVKLNGQQQAPAASPAEEKVFNWTTSWYPVFPIESLDPKAPTHVDLLGKSLVVWADSKGQWQCMEDKCPHRLVMLSEGRVEGDRIQCAYHGWEFNSSGKCERIPQITDPSAHATACSSAKSCVRTYPTRVSHGLLWVWPESGPQAVVLAEATPNFETPIKDRTPWFIRDLPLRYDALLENVIDPSHVPFAHHGVQGNRTKPTTFDFHRTAYGKQGFTVTNKSELPFRNFSIQFSAPFSARYQPSAPGSPPFLELMLVPTKPGWTRMLASFPTRMARAPWFVNVILAIRNAIPWVDHAFERNAVLDGDTYFLHVAERELPLSKGVGLEWVKKTYMPASADTPILTLRQWLQDFGGNVPTCSPSDEARMQPLMTKRDVLDRYSQHTMQCKHCKEGLATTEKLSTVATVVGLLATFVAVAKIVAATPVVPASAVTVGALLSGATQLVQLPGLLPAVGLVAACLLAYNRLQVLRQKFIYEDYVHAHKH